MKNKNIDKKIKGGLLFLLMLFLTGLGGKLQAQDTYTSPVANAPVAGLTAQGFYPNIHVFDSPEGRIAFYPDNGNPAGALFSPIITITIPPNTTIDPASISVTFSYTGFTCCGPSYPNAPLIGGYISTDLTNFNNNYWDNDDVPATSMYGLAINNITQQAPQGFFVFGGQGGQVNGNPQTKTKTLQQVHANGGKNYVKNVLINNTGSPKTVYLLLELSGHSGGPMALNDVSFEVNGPVGSCPVGYTPPVLSTATVTAGSVDLTSMVTGTLPANTTVEWHSVADPVDDSTLLPGTTVTATSTPTNYYAVYHFDDGTDNCYSPTVKVTVVGNDCSVDGTTADLTALPHSAIPTGASLVWYEGQPMENGGTLQTLAQAQAAGAGTYWPYFYDSINGCYSPVGDPVVVGIENCLDPFDCNDNGNIYLVDAGGATQLYSIDYSTTPYTKQVIGDTSHGIQYHAIGYNRTDNYIYALSVQNSVRKLYKIGSDGMPVELGTVTALASGANYIVGGIAGNQLIVKQNNLTTDFEAIDLTDLSVTTIPAYGHNMGDVTYNEVDGKLYFVSRGKGSAGSTETGHLVSIEVATGIETVFPYDNLALIGANAGGMLSTATGKVLAINNAGNVFRFNLVTGRATQVGTIAGMPSAYDAASCLADWILDACTQPGTAGTALTSSVGITTKGNPTVSNWPESVPNGYLVLDSENKGMVITHMTTAQINALTPVEGMLVYDTTAGCVKLYRGTSPGVNPTATGWVCIERICKE